MINKKVCKKEENEKSCVGIYNDRFGYLGCKLNANNPVLVLTNKSQEKAILSNFSANGLPEPNFKDIFSSADRKMDLVLMKVPKSLDLFQLFLEQIAKNSLEEVKVICSFMTRNFSPRLFMRFTHVAAHILKCKMAT